MWLRRVVESVTVTYTSYHACDNIEMLTKTKTMLVQDSMYQNYSKFSLKSSKQHSYKAKQKSARNATQYMGSGLTPK